MDGIMFNAVLRFKSTALRGFYRVVVNCPPSAEYWLYRIADLPGETILNTNRKQDETVGGRATKFVQVSDVEIDRYAQLDEIKVVNMQPFKNRLRDESESTLKQRLQEKTRLAIADEFLDGLKIQKALLSVQGLGPLIKRAMLKNNCSRATVYRIADLLFQRGFSASSLRLEHENCGAKGKTRPWGSDELSSGLKRLKPGRRTNKQRGLGGISGVTRGVSEKDRQMILRSYLVHRRANRKLQAVYTAVLEDCFVTDYKETPTGPVAIMPPSEQIITKRQFETIIRFEFDKLERLKAQTTSSHFSKHERGMRGRSYMGVSGPGHTYAFDATIGDIYLRSSVNRSWIIGRPVVYFIVDFWSTAIVGFYVCLTGPSWATAQTALFSALMPSELIGELWGYAYNPCLSPAPATPYFLMTDRGEFFCSRARISSLELGMGVKVNPAYTPNLKGMVEVLHRIHNQHMVDWVPGAFNARRKEMELRPDARLSQLTLREYAWLIASDIEMYNLSANRQHRLQMQMIGRVAPSPAGLWKFGHETGIGYQRHNDQNKIIRELLPMGHLHVNRSGAFFNGLEYSGSVMHEREWTTHAKSFGAFTKETHFFPQSTSKIWVPDNGISHMDELKIATTAPIGPDASHDEWADAKQFKTHDSESFEYDSQKAKLEAYSRRKNILAGAGERTNEAMQADDGPKPHFTEARQIEIAQSEKYQPPLPQPSSIEHDENYELRGESKYERIFRKLSQNEWGAI